MTYPNILRIVSCCQLPIFQDQSSQFSTRFISETKCVTPNYFYFLKQVIHHLSAVEVCRNSIEENILDLPTYFFNGIDACTLVSTKSFTFDFTQRLRCLVGTGS